MTTTAAARAERLARARKEQAERGVDALLLGPSADLAYLTGYRPPALERLTMLVVPAAGDPRLIVPALEAPLARDHLGELEIEVAAWPETADPMALVAGALAEAGRPLAAWASATSCGAPSCSGSRTPSPGPPSPPPRR
jgi:Xaa-Pro aminopeptidase